MSEGAAAGEKQLSMTVLMTPDMANFSGKVHGGAILKLLDEVSIAAFKKKWKDLPANFKKGLRDGSEKEGLEGFPEGCMFASLTSSHKPIIWNRDKSARIVNDPEQFYAGVWARAMVNCYSYDTKGKGVALGLNLLQKLGDGPRIGGGPGANAETAFADHELTEADEAWLTKQGAEFGASDDEDGGF